MKKIFVAVCLILFLASVGNTQGLTTSDIVSSFTYRMKSDDLTFPTATKGQIVNLACEMACTYGLSYPKLDTIVLATGTEAYGLLNTAIWVYRVGKIQEAERSWQRVALGELGQYEMKEPTNPAYYDFVTVMEDVDSTFSDGGDTSYVYVYPKPTAADNGDSILVSYFAWADTINANVRDIAHDLVLELALMIGYCRKGRTDLAVQSWNNAQPHMDYLLNYWLGRIYDIEIVPKLTGGR